MRSWSVRGRRRIDAGSPLTALIEEGLKLAMRRPLGSATRARVQLPVPPARDGTLPGVDLDSSAALLDRMERRA
jgi:hypothetical protein